MTEEEAELLLTVELLVLMLVWGVVEDDAGVATVVTVADSKITAPATITTMMMRMMSNIVASDIASVFLETPINFYRER